MLNLLIEILKIILLGIVEGITEWLPISSTGHMILVEEFIKLTQSATFIKTFFILVQLGAILAVIVSFSHKLNPYDFQKKRLKHATIGLWLKVGVASLPAAILGLMFSDKIDQLFFNPVTVAVMLIAYGVGFILIERHPKPSTTNRLSQISYLQALAIGGFQVLALIPGTSRSGATILGGLILKIRRSIITEFSFFMAIPVMFGASLLKIIKTGFKFSLTEWGLLIVGMITAFVISWLAIRFLVGYIKKHDFQFFGWYRVILGALVLIYFAIR